MTDLRAAPSAEPATWIVDRIHSFAQNIGSVVPEGFAHYVRILHPAERYSSDRALVPVTWTEIAERNGKTAHAEMQFAGLVGMWLGTREADRGQPPLWDQWPDEGSLPHGVAAALVPLLSRHSGRPDRCWFAAWDGFGDLRPDVARAPAFQLPARRYHLLEGPLTALLESCGEYGFQSFNLCWPDDRSWCMATDIDLISTYVGASHECVSELLDELLIEASREARPGHQRPQRPLQSSATT